VGHQLYGGELMSVFNFAKIQQDSKKFAGLTPSQQALAKSTAKQQLPSWVSKGAYTQYLQMGMYKAAEELGFYKKPEPVKKAAPVQAAPAEAAPVETKVEVTPETQALQTETKKLMDEIETLKGQLTDSDTQFEEYKKQQDEIAAQTQATAAAQYANQAMAGLAPTLQIGGAAAAGPMKTGTSAFKIKKDKKPTSTITPLNIGSSSPLNI
jgi:hypothetical protein